MNEKYTEALRALASEYDMLSVELFRLAHKLEEVPQFNPHNELYSLVRKVEQDTVELRNLAARTAWSEMRSLYESVSDAMGICVEEEPHWIKITMPAILPKRNTHDNSLYLTRPLRSCLLRFQAQEPMERFGRCVISIVHQYDEALGTRRVRDYDNIETKRFLDVIESVFLTNDSGLLCSVFQTTKLADRDATEFYLMLPESFLKWVDQYFKTNT